MSDMKEKPAPSYAPVYAAALYPDLCQIFHSHGYALCVHGSLQNDFDLLAVTWGFPASIPQIVVNELLARFNVEMVNGPDVMNGRLRYMLSIGFGECRLDLQFVSPSSEWASEQLKIALATKDKEESSDI